MTASKIVESDVESSPYCYPAVTVDVLIFSIIDEKLKVVLIKRGVAPFKGSWALPGGFVQEDESLEDAARRELEEEAGVREVFLEQLYTFGEPNRDPRGRVITVVYYALVPSDHVTLAPATDADDAGWFSLDDLPPLAFDHAEILQKGVHRLKSKLEYSTIAYGLLPARFRLSELQRVYEIILGREIDKRNFRKKMLASNLLEPTRYVDAGQPHRPAQLYRFKKRDLQFFDVL